MTEVEADSGSIKVLQVGGGTDDGTVYQLNTTDNDVTTPIDGYVQMEIGSQGYEMHFSEIMIRTKSNDGNVTITPSENGVTKQVMVMPMAAEEHNDSFRRNRKRLDLNDYHISLKIQNDSIGESLYLLDIGLMSYAMEEY